MSYRYDTVPVHKAASGSRKKLGAILACKSTVNWVWYAESKVESERSKLISISCTKTARITPVEQLANITSIGHVLSPVLVVCGSSLINLSHFFRPEIISDPSPTLLTTPFPISSAWRPHHWLSLSLSLSLPIHLLLASSCGPSSAQSASVSYRSTGNRGGSLMRKLSMHDLIGQESTLPKLTLFLPITCRFSYLSTRAD